MTHHATTTFGSTEPDTDDHFVSVIVADQLFGIPVMEISDVLGPQNIAPIPLARPDIIGALNLRGRIVTAIDMRTRLGIPRQPQQTAGMNIVVEYHGELYSIIVDRVGEVLSLPATTFENNPATLDSHWRDVSVGIYRLKDQLLIALDIQRFLKLETA